MIATPPTTVAIAEATTDAETESATPCFTIEFELADTGRRRYRFEPRHNGAGWWRFEDAWTGTEWECLDRQVATDASLSIDGIAVLED